MNKTRLKGPPMTHLPWAKFSRFLHVTSISPQLWTGNGPGKLSGLIPWRHSGYSEGARRDISFYLCKSQSHSVVSDSLQPHELYSPWNSPGQNTGVGSLSLLQGIFQTQGSNPGLPHCRRIPYQLSHKGSPIYAKLFLKWGKSVKPFVYTAKTTWTVKSRIEKFFNNLFLSSLENLIC